ncbi:MAG: 5'/3'-nucleotidase SurE [Proteobacteria bacterium]|nr:5'/3'-nucleotidase SurE [Pseudomonadota bacterium]
MMIPPRPRILLTNDDSHDSPLFLLAIRTLKQFGDVEIVVPATEQSWKGKSMTRYGALYVDRIDLHGTPAWSVSGTPADCVNLAIHNLLAEPPHLVVSGINIGKNVGLGFTLASGTIGACLEANIAGLPALALSQEIAPEEFRHWDAERSFKADTITRVTAVVEASLPDIWRELVVPDDFEATTWNVNFPFKRAPDSGIVRARLGLSYYRGCFKQRGDQFHHALASAELDTHPETDDAVLQAGHISATRIDIRTLGQHR